MEWRGMTKAVSASLSPQHSGKLLQLRIRITAPERKGVRQHRFRFTHVFKDHANAEPA
jgi:hypothetical protein